MESVGGFYESVHSIGHMLVFFISTRLFMSTFINSLYQVQNPESKPEDMGINVKDMYKEADKDEINSDAFLK